jgi:hypothetical protein
VRNAEILIRTKSRDNKVGMSAILTLGPMIRSELGQELQVSLTTLKALRIIQRDKYTGPSIGLAVN